MLQRYDLQLGYSCNNNCIHCFNLNAIISLRKQGKPLDKSAEEIKEILRKAKNEGVNKLVFTGGEPTIRSDFLELLEFASKNFRKIGLQTNGRMFSLENFARKTLEICPALSFTIPFHHSRKEIFDSITRVKGSFEQTFKGIKNLLKFGAKEICLKRVLLKQNYKDLENFVKLTNKLKIKKLDFTFVEGGGNARINWSKIAPHYSEIQPYLKKAIDLANSFGIEVTCYDIPFCFLNGYEKHVSEINTYIKPYLKQEFPERISDRRENIIKELVLGRRKKSQKCNDCRFYKVCLGVWQEYLELYGDKEFKPVKGEKIETWSELYKILRNSR